PRALFGATTTHPSGSSAVSLASKRPLATRLPLSQAVSPAVAGIASAAKPLTKSRARHRVRILKNMAALFLSTEIRRPAAVLEFELTRDRAPDSGCHFRGAGKRWLRRYRQTSAGQDRTAARHSPPGGRCSPRAPASPSCGRWQCRHWDGSAT